MVLFEKLFRRVLVNVNKNAGLSIICTRSLIRLYSVCWDVIGTFDDMLLIVKMLDESADLELQHCLLDLIVLLSSEESNLHQLLDDSFVGSVIKYASLAHLNPDQSGNVLARMTTGVLMLRDEERSSDNNTSNNNNNSSSNGNQNGSSSGTNSGSNNRATPVKNQAQSQPVQQRSHWVSNTTSLPVHLTILS